MGVSAHGRKQGKRLEAWIWEGGAAMKSDAEILARLKAAHAAGRLWSCKLISDEQMNLTT